MSWKWGFFWCDAFTCICYIVGPVWALRSGPLVGMNFQKSRQVRMLVLLLCEALTPAGPPWFVSMIHSAWWNPAEKKKKTNKKKTLGANENFMAQCLHSSSISSSHHRKIIMFLERKRFGSISFSPSFSLLYFFLSLYLPYTHSRTVILKNLMQIKQNTAPLPGFSLQRFLTALCNYASLKHTKFLLTVLEGMLFCSVSK